MTTLKEGRSNSALTAETEAFERRSRKPTWLYLIAGVAIGGVAVWGLTRYLDNAASANDETDEVVTLSTVTAALQTLTEEVEWTGTLGYGDPVSVSGPSGTVTDAAEVGAVLERGDIITSVDNSKISVFYGSTPLYRSLTEGVVGPDVRLLESNLVALGYDPDGTVTIDDEYTYNTGLMVQRWQADLGNEETASVEAGDVAVVAGPVSVSAISAVGQSAGTNMATLEPQRSLTDVISNHSGTVTNLAPIGATISHGSTLYTVDEIDVISLGFSEPVALVMTADGFTVDALERALVNGGYDPDEQITVDDLISDATVAAVERWQADVGLPVTGQTDPAFYFHVPDGQLVETHYISEDTYQAAGRPVLTTSASELSVVVDVSVSDEQEFEVGQSVKITLADNSETDGRVAALGSVTQTTGDPIITVVINVEAPPDLTLVEGPVTVTTISSEVVDALVIPTRALVSLREGGYAVEIERNGTSELVAIEIGSFDDGLVQVTSGDLAEGDNVVVPQ